MNLIEEIKEFLGFLGIKDYEVRTENNTKGDENKLKIILDKGNRRQKIADATYYPNMNLILIEGATETKLGRVGLFYILAHELSHLRDMSHGEKFKNEFFRLYEKIRDYIKIKNGINY